MVSSKNLFPKSLGPNNQFTWSCLKGREAIRLKEYGFGLVYFSFSYIMQLVADHGNLGFFLTTGESATIHIPE